MTAERRDIVVLGGGPAGAFAARCLRRDGYDVALVDPDRTSARVEGVSPRVVAVLARAGIDPADLALTAPAERRSRWMGTASSANAEHLVDRAEFDRALRRSAGRAGVAVHADMVAGLDIDAGEVVASLAGGTVIRARLAIDARGRRAPRPQDLTRGPPTISASVWLPTRSDCGRPRTTVVPAPDGWVWIAEPGDGRCWLQVAFDASDLQGSGADAVARAVRSVLAGGAVAETLGADPVPTVPPLVRACETICAGPALTPPVVRIGDAATGLDPLSGHGMFWAVSSALSAVPIIRALFDGDDGDVDLAKRFYGARVRDTFLRQARVGRDFYRLETRWRERPFWSARSDWPDDRPIHETGDVSVSRAVVVADGRLEEADVLVTPAHPGGVAWVAGLPIVPIYENCLRGAATPPDAETIDRNLSSDATPEQARAVLAWLQQQQLIAGASAPATP